MKKVLTLNYLKERMGFFLKHREEYVKIMGSLEYALLIDDLHAAIQEKMSETQ